MVFGIIAIAAAAAAMPIACVALPTAATSTATSAATLAQSAGNQQQGKGDSAEPDPSNDPRLAKFTVRARCDSKSSVRDQVDGGIIVLREGKVSLLEHSSESFVCLTS